MEAERGGPDDLSSPTSDEEAKEKSLEVGGGDGRTESRLYFIALNRTLKNGEDGKFHLVCIFPR